MVVPVDATCSGIQHYSAMLRDEVGGRAVNLVPHLPRQDIYQDVADEVIDMLMNDQDNPVSQNLIKFGITRSMTKRQVMVVPYSGTFQSCMKYTRAAITDKLNDGQQALWDLNDNEQEQAHVVKLSQCIWSAISKIVVKSKEAMDWLTSCARIHSAWANKQGTALPSAYDKSMTWTTPDGFIVIHHQPNQIKQQVETSLDGRVRLTYYDNAATLCTNDMASAIAPNFVHSLDACLLRMSVMKALDIGITDFCMVHDSFGVHAGCMKEYIDKCIKPAFIEMYQEDQLKNFAENLPEGVEFKDLPTKGALDLSAIQGSEFFFS